MNDIRMDHDTQSFPTYDKHRYRHFAKPTRRLPRKGAALLDGPGSPGGKVGGLLRQKKAAG